MRAAAESVFASAGRLRAQRLTTGMIFQQHHLIGRLSVLRNVLVGRLGARGTLSSMLPASRRDRHLALAAIDRVGLLDRALDRADTLSGGQQQRVGIARAMAQEPVIVLADEPVASLDPATAERVLTDLHRICREDGITAIVSLHQVEFARRFADRIIGLCRGRVVFDGAAAALTGAAIARIYEAAKPPPAVAAA
jgi:phosphonate transport system ATP-binding protein